VHSPLSDGELLRAYAATRWRVALPDGEVMVRLGRPAPDALRSTAIVTAYNPASRRVSAARNRRADAALRRWIDRMGFRSHSVDAVPEEGNEDAWREPGFAVHCGRDEAVALGRRYGQNAVVWIDCRGRVSLVATRPGFCGAAPGDELPPVR
jgi:hypothetical protein